MAVKRYAVCLTNHFGRDFDGGDLLPGISYELIADAKAEAHVTLRVVDDSGEDYVYPATAFHVLSEAESRLL